MVSPIAEPLTHVAIPEERETAIEAKSQPNVGELERVISVMVGSLLMTKGIRRMSLGGAAIAFTGYRLMKRGATGQCALYKALDVTTRGKNEGVISSKVFTHPLHQHIRVQKSATINKPVEEVFKFWRNLENFPKFMDHLESVSVIDDKRSHWVVTGPAEERVEWEATIVEEEANRKIAWKSGEGAPVPNSGQVLFRAAPGVRGTIVTVLLSYDPPGGIFGAMFAKIFGKEPGQKIQEDLRRAKMLLEAGEMASIEGQPKGSCGKHA